jgi:hypothetical protein
MAAISVPAVGLRRPQSPKKTGATARRRQEASNNTAALRRKIGAQHTTSFSFADFKAMSDRLWGDMTDEAQQRAGKSSAQALAYLRGHLELEDLLSDDAKTEALEK